MKRLPIRYSNMCFLCLHLCNLVVIYFGILEYTKFHKKENTISSREISFFSKKFSRQVPSRSINEPVYPTL